MDGVAAVRGSWTSEPIYDPETFRTTFTDRRADHDPDELVGELIELTSGTLRFHALIAANSATDVTVFGDLTNRSSAGQSYSIVDYHPLWDYAAVDSGTGADAPATDIEGSPRPVDIPGVGADGTGQEYDIGAYEAQEVVLPPTRVGPEDWVLY